MTGWIEKSLLAGMGVLTLTRDKVTQAVDTLVEAGSNPRRPPASWTNW